MVLFVEYRRKSIFSGCHQAALGLCKIKLNKKAGGGHSYLFVLTFPFPICLTPFVFAHRRYRPLLLVPCDRALIGPVGLFLS